MNRGSTLFLKTAVMLIGMIIAGASMVIAVFAAAIKKLLQEVIDIKSENDLTV